MAKVTRENSFEVQTSLVRQRSLASQAKPCKHCGFAPVRLETTFASGSKAFAWLCPNGQCNPKGRHSMPMPSRNEAVLAWNAAN